LPPTPTTAAKARVRARVRGKARTTTPATIAATTVGVPQRPLLQSLGRHHLDVARDASSTAAVGASAAARLARYTGVL
jgi:hypothetical protein